LKVNYKLPINRILDIFSIYWDRCESRNSSRLTEFRRENWF